MIRNKTFYSIGLWTTQLCSQVSQYTFAICSYKEKKSDPSEMMQLDGYTVDYIEPAGGNLFYRVCAQPGMRQQNPAEQEG